MNQNSTIADCPATTQSSSWKEITIYLVGTVSNTFNADSTSKSTNLQASPVEISIFDPPFSALEGNSSMDFFFLQTAMGRFRGGRLDVREFILMLQGYVDVDFFQQLSSDQNSKTKKNPWGF